jgi:tetratricopeptide (TPR) repeat protein
MVELAKAMKISVLTLVSAVALTTCVTTVRVTAAAEMPAVPATADQQKSVDPTDDAVDESALRYFARKGDKIRLEAEIARLRALHPQWTPPADPLAAPVIVDRQLDAMWQLYADAKYDELEKAIAERKRAQPGWVPPADLTSKLAEAESRRKLVAASDAKLYEEVVALGARAPHLLTCGDVDVLWRVAEAFANTARVERAIDAYAYILDNCPKPEERLATVMKAAALLDYGQMQGLLAHEKTLDDGKGEFEPIRDDLARRFVSEGDINARLEVAPAYLARLATVAETGGKASDALLLGWYYMKRDRLAEAGTFFRRAHDHEDSASASQGLALTLIAAKKPAEAEAVMARWRDSSDEAWATYFAATANLLAMRPPPVIEADILARMAEAAARRHDVRTAEGFGWYALSFKQPRTAARWFRTTLGWKPDHEPAAYGLAVARLRLNDTAGVRQIQKLWAGRSDRIATLTEPRGKRQDIESPIPSPDSVVQDDIGIDGEATQSIDSVNDPDRDLTTRSIRKAVQVADASAPRKTSGCGRQVDPATLSPKAALDRGWCLMQLDRPLEAAAAFEIALGASSAKTREDAAYGQSLAYLRAGLVDKAAVAATRARQDTGRAVELQSAILSDRAVNAFGAGRYRETIAYLDQLAQLQSERTDLLVLRAYAYARLGRKSEALRIFETLAATGNRDAIKGLGDLRAEDERR